MNLAAPYLLFLGDEANRHTAKIARGLCDWAPEKCLGQYSLSGNSLDLGLPELSPAEAVASGARTMILAVTNFGGYIPDVWHPALLEALDAGLDLASGMHDRLSEIPMVRDRAAALGRRLHDVRHTDRPIPVATGRDRPGRRLLTVGTDCALGKKYTALSLARALQARGVPATFRATGQTGILIAGEGIAVDAVAADFIAGAAEILTSANAAGHWDIVEGQGSLFHPAYSGVSLGLLCGTKPHALVLCHDPSRMHVNGYPDFPLPSLADCMAHHLACAALVSPTATFVGISLNTSIMNEGAALDLLRQTSDETGLPCIDPVRFGADAIAETLR